MAKSKIPSHKLLNSLKYPYLLLVHYSLGFTAYKAASGGVFFRCETPKDAVYKDYKVKTLVRRSVHPRILHIYIYIYCEYHETKCVRYASNSHGFEFVINFFANLVYVRWLYVDNSGHGCLNVSFVTLHLILCLEYFFINLQYIFFT